jgi:C-terminal processing protease CtpA/Prc
MAGHYGMDTKKVLSPTCSRDPADAAGIKQDIIVEVNGRKWRPPVSSRAWSPAPVGESAKIKVVRDGQSKTFSVKIAKRDDARPRGVKPEKRDDQLGLRVSPHI